MLTVAYVFAALAALVHVYIFWIEAIVFETTGRKAFGIGAEDAATMKSLFYNQGFYNLFLAIGTGVGIGIAGSDRDAGIALITLATGSMLAAALVLITSDPSKARGAVVQGLFPAIGLIALGIWALAG
jgi:putative membrane protein